MFLYSDTTKKRPRTLLLLFDIFKCILALSLYQRRVHISVKDIKNIHQQE